MVPLVRSLLGHQCLFLIFYLSFEYFVGVQSPKPLNKNVSPNSWKNDLQVCKPALFRQTGLQKMREPYILCLEGGLVSPKDDRKMACTAHCWRTSIWLKNQQIGGKDSLQDVCWRMRRLEGFLFLYEAAKYFELFLKFKIKI